MTTEFLHPQVAMNLTRQSSDDIWVERTYISDWSINEGDIKDLVLVHDPGMLLAAGQPPNEYDDEIAELSLLLHLRIEYDELFDFVVFVFQNMATSASLECLVDDLWELCHPPRLKHGYFLWYTPSKRCFQ